MTLCELVKKFIGDQVYMYFEDFNFENRDTCPPDVIVSNKSNSYFDIDRFIMENPLGRRSVRLFDCTRNAIHVLVDEEEDQNDSENS